MGKEDFITRYNKLFSMEQKAEAFDKIAANYYNANFGNLSKSDIDLLMFSIYMERILDGSENNCKLYIENCSDYKMSNDLGITQSRISNLKVKKQLVYPVDNFEWKKFFLDCCENARYRKNKIELYIPDKNVYLEVKNIIESNGGIVDVTLNSNVLKVSPEYYIDVLLLVSGTESSRDEIIEKLKDEFKKNKIDEQKLDRQTFGEILKGAMGRIAINIICLVFKQMLEG